MRNIAAIVALFALWGCSNTGPLSKEEATRVLKARYHERDVVWETTIDTTNKARGYRVEVQPDSLCALVLAKTQVGRIVASEDGPRLQLALGRDYSKQLEYPCGVWTFDRLQGMVVVSPQEVKARFLQHQEPPQACLDVLEACKFVKDMPRRMVLEITLQRDSQGNWLPMYWRQVG
jgi:hypothetical protein